MDAVETLRKLQEEYQEWLDNLPENLQSTAVAEQLDEVCSLDMEQLELGFPGETAKIWNMFDIFSVSPEKPKGGRVQG